MAHMLSPVPTVMVVVASNPGRDERDVAQPAEHGATATVAIDQCANADAHCQQVEQWLQE